MDLFNATEEPKRKSAPELRGEFFREIGILIVVFLPIDAPRISGLPPDLFAVVGVGLGAALWWIGYRIELGREE